FGEYSSASAPLLAFAGSKNHLLQRVKRILYNQNKKPGFMEKSILFSSVIMLSVITAFTSIRNENKPLAPEVREIKTFVSDTIPDKVDENVNEDQPSRAENRKRKKRMRDTEQKEKENQKLEQIEQKLQEVQLQFDNDIQLK